MIPAPAELAAWCQPFGVDVATAEPLSSSQNRVFRSRDQRGDSCILRVSMGRHRTQQAVEAELTWIETLAAAGLPVCRPRRSHDGGWCVPVERESALALVTCFEHAPGIPVDRQTAEPQVYERLGILIAQMHEVSRSMSPAVSYARDEWQQSRLLQEDLQAQSGKLSSDFLASLQELQQGIAAHDRGPTEFGLIHADINFNNLHQDGEQLWLFDFDNCEFGYFAADLATLLYDSIYCRFLGRVEGHQLTAALQPYWSALWRGYQSVRAGWSLDPHFLTQLFVLREAIIHVHYWRTLPPERLTSSLLGGLEEMQHNVEQQRTLIDIPRLVALST